jgi:hypothetical protein
VRNKKEADTLTAGAVISARPARINLARVIGTGPSTTAVGRLTACLSGPGSAPRTTTRSPADVSVLEAGGTVLHSGSVSDRADDPSIRSLPLPAARRRFFPNGAPRAAIARLMLDEAGTAGHPGEIIIPAKWVPAVSHGRPDMDKTDTSAHTHNWLPDHSGRALSPSKRRDPVVIRRTLVAVTLAAAGLVPLFAASPANAIPICKAGFSCLYVYYSTPARTTVVGSASINCGGGGGLVGMTSAYFTFSEVPCNN